MTETEIWIVDLERACEDLHEVGVRLGLLTDQDRERVASVADTTLRARRLAARIALRLAIARLGGLSLAARPFTFAARGKPSLAEGGIAFSLAHTDRLALVAATSLVTVGVDVEEDRILRISEPRRERIETAAAHLAPHQAMAAAGSTERFLQAWCRIEAVGKATGDGAATTLEATGAWHGPDAADAIARRSVATLAAAGLAVHDLALPRLDRLVVAAVALPRGALAPLVRSLPTASRDVVALLAGEG